MEIKSNKRFFVRSCACVWSCVVAYRTRAASDNRLQFFFRYPRFSVPPQIRPSARISFHVAPDLVNYLVFIYARVTSTGHVRFHPRGPISTGAFISYGF